MNSFFASVEQQENPALRGKPTIVVPVMSDTTCAIAASYEAKAFGIKTGTGVKDAKSLCSSLNIVSGRTGIYRRYHKGIVEVLNEFFATIRVLSVDEMACLISPLVRESDESLARRIKNAIKARLGECLTCSVGIAPNVFLAKVASDMQKPDCLVVLKKEDLPQALYSLNLRDLPGIGRRMLTRFQVNRIMTVEDLCNASYNDLHRATGSVMGNRWYLMLRGSNEADYGLEPEAPRHSVGHSHVLPPELRTAKDAEKVILRLLSKALKRLRDYNLTACALHMVIRYRCETLAGYKYYHWQVQSDRHRPADDDLTWFKIARFKMRSIPEIGQEFSPLMVGITFTDLKSYQDVNPSLFDGNTRLHQLAKTVDALNTRFHNGVDLASVYWLRERAPDTISFGASLLAENKIDQKTDRGDRSQEMTEMLEQWSSDWPDSPEEEAHEVRKRGALARVLRAAG